MRRAHGPFGLETSAGVDSRRRVDPSCERHDVPGEHSLVPGMRVVDELADSAAELLNAAFPEDVQRLACVPGVWPSSIYRARAGERRSNPLFRIALWLYAARRAGMPRATAQLFADWLQLTIDRLWPAEALSVTAASTREQLLEADETADQVAYANGDRAVRSRWIHRIRLERAAEAELLAALEAEERAERRAAA